jgi:hypothetical protein
MIFNFKKIITNYGTTLKISAYSWWFYVYIYGFEIIPSKADFRKTNGIFGSWNDDQTDDLKYLRNSFTIAANEDAVFDSFK